MKDLLEQYKPYRKDLDFIDQFCDAENSAAGSKVDPNSNVSGHNIATLAPEIHKQANVFANRLRMHDTITEMFGKELADEYLRQLEDHEIYRHDEAGMPVGTPYCVSISLYPFLINGTKILRDNSETPRNLDSFIGSIINLAFAISGQYMGALALPEFIPYMSWFCMKEWGEDYDLHADEPVYHTLKKDRTIRDIIHQKFQQFSFSINSPCGNRNSQSVFLNISYYDKCFFDSLFETFWFPDGTKMTDTWRQVNFLQREYMMWLNKEREKAILTFPVETFSLLHDGNDFVDKESADFVAKMHSLGHSFFIYSSNSVDSLASCCYSEDTEVRVLDKNGNSVVVPFKQILSDDLIQEDGTYKVWCLSEYRKGRAVVLPNREMFEVTLDNGLVLHMTDNHRNYVFNNDHEEVGPVLTKDLIPGEHSFICGNDLTFSYVKVQSVEPYEYDGYVWCFEMEGEDKFALANGVYNYNCRLRNALDEEGNTFSYTLGAGGIATGSKCVMTLNLNRLTQNAMRKKYGFESGHIDEVRDPARLDENLDAVCAEVRKEVKKVHKYLLAFEKIMKDMLDKHMLSTYDAGFITPDKQFLTVGGNGTNQAAQYLGLTINDNPEYKKFIQRIFSTISEVDKEDRDKEHGIKFNFELVPRQ